MSRTELGASLAADLERLGLAGLSAGASEWTIPWGESDKNTNEQSDENTSEAGVDERESGSRSGRGVTKDEVIGHGAFGEVWRGSFAGTAVVLKRAIRPVYLTPDGSERRVPAEPEAKLDEVAALEREFVHEVEMLRGMRHPSVVLFMGITFGPRSNVNGGSSKGNDAKQGNQNAGRREMYIVQEFVRGGSLVSLLQNKEKKITWGARIKMALEICGALSYMHEQNLLHRDLKCENVLLETLSSSSLTAKEAQAILHDLSRPIDTDANSVRCKVADFGLATLLRPDCVASDEVGSPWWRAPEVGSGEYGLPSDVFSFGVVVAEIVTRDAAEDIRLSMTYQRRGTLEFGVRPDNYVKEYAAQAEDTPRPLIDITRRCCRENPAERPTAAQLIIELQHLQDDFTAMERLAREKISGKEGAEFWVSLCSATLEYSSDAKASVSDSRIMSHLAMHVTRERVLKALADRIRRFSGRALTRDELQWISIKFFPPDLISGPDGDIDIDTFSDFWSWFSATEHALKNRRVLPLFRAGWIKGFVGKDEACEALQQNGDFVVRFSERKPGNIVFTCLWDDEISHVLVLVKDAGGFVLSSSKLFRTVDALMAAELCDLKSVGAAPIVTSAVAGPIIAVPRDDEDAVCELEFCLWNDARFDVARLHANRDAQQEQIKDFGAGYAEALGRRRK